MLAALAQRRASDVPVSGLAGPPTVTSAGIILLIEGCVTRSHRLIHIITPERDSAHFFWTSWHPPPSRPLPWGGGGGASQPYLRQCVVTPDLVVLDGRNLNKHVINTWPDISPPLLSPPRLFSSASAFPT